MASLTIHHQQDVPALLKWQALAFMRVEWPRFFQGEEKFMADIYPPELEPVHIVVTEGDTLISYAALLRLQIPHRDTIYEMYGLGNMFTFPPYRRAGYGRQAVAAATAYIRGSSVDVGILFCDESLARYYGANGWERMVTPTYIGVPNAANEHKAVKMMLFVSDKGQHGRTAFADEPLYIEQPW